MLEVKGGRMAQRRRRNVRRNSLVFLGSLVAHLIVFYVAGRELFHPYPIASQQLPVQVEIVPETVPEIPPPPPIIKPKPEKVTTPPQPQPQPQPQPKPVIPTPQRLTARSIVKPTAPPKVTNLPSLTPATKQSVLANLPSAPIEAPQPGPPKTFSKSTVVSALPQRLVPAAPLNLHKPKEAAEGLVQPANIPGASPPRPRRVDRPTAAAARPEGRTPGPCAAEACRRASARACAAACSAASTRPWRT